MRVLLADDHRLILDGVRRALEDDGGFVIVGEAHTGAGVLPLIEEHHPDVVVLDVRMPDMDGLQCLEQIKRTHPEIKVVMLSASSSPELIESALRRGASAYVLKSVDPADLASTIRQAASGTVFSTVGVGSGGGSSASGRRSGLTEREVAVLTEVAKGRSNDEIAKALWITPQTVKFHLTNAYRKLHVKNRSEATRAALDLGLTGLGPGDEE